MNAAASEQPRESIWRELQPDEVLSDSDRETYRIVNFIAEGGYSQVYRAAHERTGDLVAIKVLHLRHARNKKTLRRQIQEANTLYELQHPNVVRVHAVGARQKDGMVFMVMDLLVGRTLRELVWDMGGKMPIPWTLEIMAAVARGLSAIHSLVIVHRDLKPDNIHVRDDGHVSLFDLGTARIPKTARLTTRGYTLGTLDYMSPEQLLDPDTIDARSDLFSLGTMLYELLTGKNPFAGTSEDAADKQAIGLRITMRPHPPIATAPGAQHVPSYLAGIVERLLEKNPADRYKSAAVVADLLERSLAKYEHDLKEKRLTPQPVSKLGEIPRRPQLKDDEEDEGATPASTRSGSTSPFVSISLPPEEAAKRAGRSRVQAPKARSMAYASTEKMPVAAYAPATGTPKTTGPEGKNNSTQEGRVAMLPFLMDEEEVADEDIEEVAEDGEDWGFESVAKLDRAPVSEGPGSSKERMFDPDRFRAEYAGPDVSTPPEASFQGDRARPTVQVRVQEPQRSRLPAVLVVVVVAVSLAVLGMVILSIAGVVHIDGLSAPLPAVSAPLPGGPP